MDMFKKLNLLAFMLLLMNVSFVFSQKKEQVVNENGFNTFYYDNGIKSSEGYMKQGRPDGYWKTFYENGNLKSEGNRKSFELDSIWKFYNEDGKLATIFNYESGRKNGYKETYSEGKLIARESFVN